VRRKEEDLVAGGRDGSHGIRQPRRRAAGDEELAPFEGNAGSGANAFDESVDERREPLRWRVLVHVRVGRALEVLHPAPNRRLPVRVADVEGIDLAPVRGEPVQELRVDRPLDA
jgi:hypothetical protein